MINLQNTTRLLAANTTRFLNTSSSVQVLTGENEHKKTNLVLGRGHISKEVILESLNNGQRVVQIIRPDKDDHTHETTEKIMGQGSLIQVTTPTKHFSDPLFHQHILNQYDIDGVVVNGVGVPNGTKECMEFANKKVPGALAESLKESDSDATLVHFSSIAALYAKHKLLGCDYPRSKLAGEEAIEASGLENHVIIRLPYVLNSTQSGEIVHIDNHHPWGPEHLTGLRNLGFKIPIIGSGLQTIPTVMTGDIAKLTSRIMENPSKHHQQTINAVSEYMSQGEMLDTFADLMGVDGKKMYIPLSVARNIAKFAPFGHLQPYAIHGLAVGEDLSERVVRDITDNSSFTEIMGEPETLRGSFSRIQDSDTVTFSEPPVFPHIKHTLHQWLSNVSIFRNSNSKN
jgi:nucleoside-diphosphate-sugar epimerase